MKINMGDKEIEVEQVDFAPVKETWNEYEAATGERIKIRLVLQDVWRVLDENGMPGFDAMGQPHFITRSQNVQACRGAEKPPLPN